MFNFGVPSNITVSRELTLKMPDPDSLPSTLYGPFEQPGVIFEYRAQKEVSPEHHMVWPKTMGDTF